MWQYLVKRLFLLLGTLLGICVLSFVIVALAPGDPAVTAAGLDPSGKNRNKGNQDQVLEHTRAALYLDRPVIVNLHPPKRQVVARDLALKVLDGTDYARADASDKLKGEVGTAALDVLCSVVNERAGPAAEAVARRHALAEKLDALGEKPDAAALQATLDEAEKELSGHVPHVAKTASPADRAKAWASWVHDRESEPAAGVTALLDTLAAIVPPDQGGPTPTGSVVERAKAWADWWTKNSARYSPESARTVVQAYMSASDADRPAKLEDVKRVGAAAVAAIMDAYHGASGADRSHAAFALSLVAHKPWDLTTKPQDVAIFEHEWADDHDKLEKDHAAGKLTDAFFATREAQLGAKDEYVARAVEKQHADQARNIARWWFRAEENFVDFSAPRQLARAFTQTQFGNWFRSLVGGLDFGRSYAFKKDVSELIKERLPVTLWLNFFSIFFTYLIAIPLGIFSATHQRTVADRVTTVVLFLLYSLPSFWVGSILILLLTGPPGLSWFPSHGMESMDAANLPPLAHLWDIVVHLTLPVVCLTYGGIAMISRFMRGSMLETIRQDFIRTARAKGLSERVVVYKHALRNSLIPILTILAYLLPAMFGGSIIIESIFSIEGLGKLMFDAILNRDYPVIMSEVVISGFLTLLGILLADISYAVVDPRIELK